jgi:uncharacterized protein YjaG (DUF416 family)
MLRYDESALLDRLAGASPRARALFAARVAERLFGLYEYFAERAAQGDPNTLRAALDAAWKALDTDVPTAELARQQELAEDLVPEEDDDWVTESGYAQNAAAAVAYALRTRLTDNPQEAAWAARQAYDTTDYAAQRQLEDVEFDDAGEDALVSQPVVQEALAGLNTDLEAALAEPPAEETSRLRDEARQGSARLVELVRE